MLRATRAQVAHTILLFVFCYRLWSHDNSKTRRPFNTPELDKTLCCKGKVTVLINTSLFPTNCTTAARAKFVWTVQNVLQSCSPKGLSKTVMGQKNAQLVLLLLCFGCKTQPSSGSHKRFKTGAVKVTVQLVRNKFARNRQLHRIRTILNSLSLIKEKSSEHRRKKMRTVHILNRSTGWRARQA